MGPNAMSFYRTAKRLRALRVPLVPDLLVRLGARLHGTWVDLEAELEEDVELGYGGMGVVIEAGTRIGRGSFLCQQVTLGTRPGARGAPWVGKDVVIGSGAQVLGPVTIGDRAVIGANAVVTEDVPAGTVVAGIPAHVLHRRPLALAAAAAHD